MQHNNNGNQYEAVLDDPELLALALAVSSSFQLLKDFEELRDSGAYNTLNAISAAFINPSIYSLIHSAVDLTHYYQKKENPVKILSNLISLATTGLSLYPPQQLLTFTTATSLVGIGLAINSGVDCLIALRELFSKWETASYPKKMTLVCNAVTNTLLFCGWVSLAAGNPLINAIFLLLAMSLSFSQLLGGCLLISRHDASLFANNRANIPASEPAANATKEFTGTPYRLGSNYP